ncbi:MAG: rhodanese-like domain-containing protein [Planctomycetota bacterium]
MLLKYFYDSALAHASYMVGCQRTGEAVIVDPGRDIQQYLDMAEQHGMRITAVAETHIHADYVSGAREIPDRVNATLYLSDEGPAEWKYQFADQYPSVLVKDGDSFEIGNIKFDVMHTPGHTPESVSYVLTDVGGGANKPMGIFTGDFVFVGSIGRPDLLEEAAGVVGSAEEGAKQLYQSVLRFKQLPDYLQLWPAHGAGSACGKGLGAIPSSTVGYEKLFNPALQFATETEFVQYILADQPPAPAYFAIMKRVNKEGPKVIGETTPEFINVEEMESALENGTVVDVTSSSDFAAAHFPKSINLPIGSFATWGGWLIDYTQPLYFICDSAEAGELQRVAEKMGMDSLIGFFDSEHVTQSKLRTASYEQVDPSDIEQQIRDKQVDLFDVRSDAEWDSGHIAEAQHHFLGKLWETGPGAIGNKPIVVQCLGGGRSAIGASILKSLGAKVINLRGGINAWRKANLPTTKDA